MSQITTLITGAGVPTLVLGQKQCEQYILIGDIDTAQPLQSLQVTVDNVSYINVQNNAALLTAYAKWISKWTGTVIGMLFKIATGRIPLNTDYRFTNNGATTPAVYAFSDNDFGVPFVVGTSQINANSYQDFSNFSALFIGTPANISNAEIVFNVGRDANGNKIFSKQTMVPVELDAYLAQQFNTEADGRLGGITVIDNTQQNIESIRLTASAAVTIMIVKIPDTAWAAIKGK